MLNAEERRQLTALAHEHDELPASEGDLRLVWTPQFGNGSEFVRRVRDLDEALALADALAAYDAFQLVHNIKGDYANGGDLEVFEGGEWLSYEDPENALSFDEIRAERRHSAAPAAEAPATPAR